jgi:ferritin-like metal-binding protein YciE
MAKTKSSKPSKTAVDGFSKLPAETSVVSSSATDTELIRSAAVTPKDSGLDELFLSSLKDIYWAEKHLVKSLPIMIDAAGGSQLQEALTEHLAVTKNQVDRLEQVFSSLGEKVVAQKCDAMEGLTISGENIIENTLAGSEARDTGIVMSGLKVENFEITSYKGLIQVATKLGYTDAATLFQSSLEEEVEAENILNTIAANS